jgi:hypothetical protein
MKLIYRNNMNTRDYGHRNLNKHSSANLKTQTYPIFLYQLETTTGLSIQYSIRTESRLILNNRQYNQYHH